MNLIDHLRSRRSVRSFDSRAVPDSVLEDILAAASRAPTGGSMQLYTAIVTTDVARKEALAGIHFGVESIRSAAAVLTFCIDIHRLGRWLELAGEVPGFDNAWGLAIGYSDALVAAQSATLAAESLGLGTCFLGSTVAASPMLCGFFGLPAHVLPVATVILGYPKEDQAPASPSSRLPVATVFHRETYAEPTDAELSKAYAEHGPATFEMFARMPSNAAGIEAFGIKNLEMMYARLNYPPDLLELSGMYFLAAMTGQGFISEQQVARAKAARATMADPAVGALSMTRQLVFSLALASGALDGRLARSPSALETEVFDFVNAAEPTLYEEFTAMSVFHPGLRARLHAALGGFGAQLEQAAE
jgi:nitroreductase